MSHAAIGAIGALTIRVQQPHTLLILGLNAGMSTAVGADELVEILTDVEHPISSGRVFIMNTIPHRELEPFRHK